MKIYIPDSIINHIFEEGKKSPVEICGILIGKKFQDNWYAEQNFDIENISKDNIKIVDYNMNPQQLFNVLKNTTTLNKNAKKDFIAIWHTHPKWLAIPSSIDTKRVAYPVVYLIYGQLNNTLAGYIWNFELKQFDEIEIINIKGE